MNILITGGSGFIGSHLIKRLIKEYDNVEILNLDLNPSSISSEKLKTIICDIRNEINLEIENFKFDACIHLAALCKEPGYEWEEYFETNHIGTKNVIDLCSRLNTPEIIFTSTMMVYKPGDEVKTEKAKVAPDTAYGISKILAEKELEIWKNSVENRILKIIRPAVVFGENENANFTRLYQSLKKGFFPYIGRKTTIKSNIYVRELVNFTVFLLGNSSAKTTVFNFAFPQKYDMSKIIFAFKSVFKFKPLTPIFPYKLMILISYFFQFLNSIGVKNSIHYRRIQKLYNSTYIHPENALSLGYSFKYDLESSLEDWKNSNDKNL